MLADTDLACTADTWMMKVVVEGSQVSDGDKQIVFIMPTVKGGRKLFSNACNEFLKGRLPIILTKLKQCSIKRRT